MSAATSAAASVAGLTLRVGGTSGDIDMLGIVADLVSTVNDAKRAAVTGPCGLDAMTYRERQIACADVALHAIDRQEAARARKALLGLAALALIEVEQLDKTFPPRPSTR